MTNEMKQSYEEKINTLEKEKVAIKEEYEGILLESEDQFKEQDAQYESERAKVEKLQNDMKQAAANSTQLEELRQMEIKLLEESVQAAKVKMDSKEGECERVAAELKESRDRVTHLEATVKILENNSRHRPSGGLRHSRRSSMRSSVRGRRDMRNWKRRGIGS